MSPEERRNSRYGFESLGTMSLFFSRWIPESEIDQLIRETETKFRPRLDSSDEETQLQKIQKAEYAIVRKLVTRNPSFP